MTTIAYKDGIVAFDSRMVDGADTIASDSFQKMHKHAGCTFFFAGSTPDQALFLDRWESPEKGTNLSVSAFVWDGSTLWYCGSDDHGIWRSPVDCHRAIGSGKPHALTAMDMGASAKEAVKAAMKRDPFTGGKIRTFRLPI